MTVQHRVLFVGLTDEQASPFATVLASREIETMVVSESEIASHLLQEQRFNAIVASYPLPTGDLGGIISTVRTRSACSVGAGLVLLAAPANLRAANGLKGRGVYRVLSHQEKPIVLAIVVEQTIEHVQPMIERLPMQLPFTIILGEDQQPWSTVNLCGRGLLIAHDAPPMVGTRFAYKLELPEAEITGEAQVVRWVTRGREPVNGFGARFLSFDGDGRAQLMAFLRHTARSRSSSMQDNDELLTSADSADSAEQV